MHKGLFITVEGIDGVGKTTQLDYIKEYLESLGREFYFTKEPGDSRFGSKIGAGVREILFAKGGSKDLAPGVGDLLFLADHVQNAYEIKSLLADGKIVVSDRYADSQFAYAASSTKRSPTWALRYFEEQFGVVPDITILLVARGLRHMTNIPGPEDISWALARANARRGVEAGKQEGKAWNDVEEQRKIQNAYIASLSIQNRGRLVNIWESSTKEEIRYEIQHIIHLALTASVPEGRQINLPIEVEAA